MTITAFDGRNIFFRRNLGIASGFGHQKISNYCGSLVAWGFKVGEQPLPGSSRRMEAQKTGLLYCLINGAACGPSASAAVRCGDTVIAEPSVSFSQMLFEAILNPEVCAGRMLPPLYLFLPFPPQVSQHQNCQFAPHSWNNAHLRECCLVHIHEDKCTIFLQIGRWI